ncbi:flagellar motor switch phosphatase FliY [Bacillota bacterium LX-D]|nr:flagellar motor switch phosphatase FliY [Bacillota bacterium LX-D]
MSNFLSQEEIDALLNSPDLVEEDGSQNDSQGDTQNEFQNDPKDDARNTQDYLPAELDLSTTEQDALGEIGNISMGSAATALSQLLGQRVNITTPNVTITSSQELTETFQVPYMLIEVSYTEGLRGTNLLVIKVSDAAIIADLMMGGDGKNPSIELSELQASAVGEAMNQMMGSAATSMSTIFQKPIVISPPIVKSINTQKDPIPFPWDNNERIVVVYFKMEIGSLVNSGIMQILPLSVAKEETGILLGTSTSSPAATPETIQETITTEPIQETMPTPPSSFEESPMDENAASSEMAGGYYSTGPSLSRNQSNLAGESTKNLELILDVPLNISVILGKTKKPIKEVLNLIPGSIVELEKYAEEPVEILVNGTLIAHGEVVVVNEYFGVRITSIDSPVQRLNNLRK